MTLHPSWNSATPERLREELAFVGEVNKALSEQVERLREAANLALDAWEQKDAEVERLREALDRFGVHLDGCAFWHDKWEGDCTCGLASASDEKRSHG